MKETYVNLPNADVIQRFVRTVTKLEGDFELVSGGHILDARSLMGIFSLDLKHPILLKIYRDTDANLEAIQPFLADMEESTHEQ